MIQKPINLRQIISFLKSFHNIDDTEIQQLDEAYALLSSYCFNQYEDNSILDHSMTVAQYIASWRFDYTVVIAAMFHDNPTLILNLDSEKRSHFAPLIYEILNSCIDIKQQVELLEEKSMVNGNVSPDYCININHLEGFYIVVANYVDLLSRKVQNIDETALVLAQHVRDILISYVKKINAYKMVDILEGLCFQILNNSTYNDMKTIISQTDYNHDYYRHKFLTKLKQIFDQNSNLVPNRMREYRSQIKYFDINKRSIVSLQRYITDIDDIAESELTSDLSKLRNVFKTAYYDLTLIVDDSIEENINGTTIDLFMNYYEALLRQENVSLFGYYYTTNRESCYFLISDSMKNMYRFFLKRESEFMHFLYGDIVNRDTFSLVYSPQTNTSKIKVFKRDGRAELLDKGSTVLDFAFRIHEDLGLHFGYALLNHNDKKFPAHTVLDNGDTVEIKKSQKISAELNWFRYVKTEYSINSLIKFFKNDYYHSGRMIQIITKDGSYLWIEEGATVLDYAFMIHEDLGLYFDYALINNSKKHFSIDHVLSDLDKVIIVKSDNVKADFYWFRHAKTERTINCLIDYFKHKV